MPSQLVGEMLVVSSTMLSATIVTIFKICGGEKRNRGKRRVSQSISPFVRFVRVNLSFFLAGGRGTSSLTFENTAKLAAARIWVVKDAAKLMAIDMTTEAKQRTFVESFRLLSALAASIPFAGMDTLVAEYKKMGMLVRLTRSV